MKNAYENGVYMESDHEAIHILDQFLPDRIFDAHAHIHDSSYAPVVQIASYGVEQYKRDVCPIVGNRQIGMNLILFPYSCLKDSQNLKQSDDYLVAQLEQNPNTVGEIIVTPADTTESLMNRLVHPRIRGFKCYHIYSNLQNTWNAEISDYLPEAAWQVANEKKLCITLHMVKDDALADPGNLRYITEMAKRYPDAILILAHAARSFASWTGVETVEKVAHLDNVWFDFSAVCESPAMLQIIRKTGTQRCMWGSDYPVCMARGKAISMGDSFYWINKEDLARFQGATTMSSWLVGVENLMAVRQACILGDLGSKDVEDIFYGNAKRLFGAGTAF